MSMRSLFVALTASSLALLPAISSGASHEISASSARINVEFQDVDIHQVMLTLAELGRVNIIVEKGETPEDLGLDIDT